MRFTDEKREKWIEDRFNELSSSGDYSGLSGEEIMDIAEEDFDFMLDELADIEHEERRDAKYED